jgi:hypothetical protein
VIRRASGGAHTTRFNAMRQIVLLPSGRRRCRLSLKWMTWQPCKQRARDVSECHPNIAFNRSYNVARLLPRSYQRDSGSTHQLYTFLTVIQCAASGVTSFRSIDRHAFGFVWAAFNYGCRWPPLFIYGHFRIDNRRSSHGLYCCLLYFKHAMKSVHDYFLSYFRIKLACADLFNSRL